MSLLWQGKAWVFGDDIPNDEGIMPLRLVRQQEYEPAALAPHCFEQIDAAFAGAARAGDVVFGGRNFGYGNPHIQGFLGLKGLGVGLVVESMSRGPLRACVNAGVPVLIAGGAAQFACAGDPVEVDFVTGLCRNHRSGALLQAPALAPVMREIVEAGGGIAHMKRVIAARAAAARAVATGAAHPVA
jgi:3-isopropylmalate/(R)-2-methylmalate dehydratase small subunit